MASPPSVAPSQDAGHCPEPSQLGSQLDRLPLGLALTLVAVIAALALLPLWVPLLLGAWFADLARPLNRKLSLWLRGKHWAASLVTVLLVVLTLSPLAFVSLSLAEDATRLAQDVLKSDSVESALQSIQGTNKNRNLQEMLTEEPEQALDLLRKGGSSALGFASTLAGATIAALIGLIVFVMSFYVFLANGSHIGGWLKRNLPLTREQFSSFSRAFYETGRGLIVGVGLAALAQGAVAGVGYLIVGLRHAFVLALLTATAALIPTLGSGIVWFPIGVILALSDRVMDAVVVMAIGSCAGLVDNFIRPVLSRVGRLTVPTFALFCAMLGGVMAFGAPGLLLGPLSMRMTMEALRLWRRPAGQRIVMSSGHDHLPHQLAPIQEDPHDIHSTA